MKILSENCVAPTTIEHVALSSTCVTTGKVLEQHNTKVKLFADDVKMYVRILDYLHVRSLQLAVDALVQWSDAWQLPISINKCCVLNIGKVAYNTDKWKKLGSLNTC